MAAALIVFTLASCSHDPEKDPDGSSLPSATGINPLSDEAEAASADEPRVINLFSTKPDSLNPLLSLNPYIKEYAHLIFDSLVTLNMHQEALPSLAVNWEVSEDLITWTFNLRSGVSWHDGSQFTAEDVKMTMDILMSKDIETLYKYNISNISSVEIKDDLTIKIVLYEPQALLPYLMTFPILQASRFSDFAEDIDIEAMKSVIPNGTGPYMYESPADKSGTCLKLAANKKWWAGEPETEYFHINISEKANDDFAYFRTGEADLILLKKGEGSRYTLGKDYTAKKYPGRYFEFISFNTKSAYSGDKSLRRAISCFIDKQAIIDKLLPGKAVPADLPVIPGTFFFDSSYASVDTINAAQAREMLEVAGWQYIDGVMYKYEWGYYRPLELVLVVNTENEDRTRVAGEIADRLLQIGVKTRIRKLPWDSYLAALKEGSYDIAFVGCTLPYEPDFSFLFEPGEPAPDTAAAGQETDEQEEKGSGGIYAEAFPVSNISGYSSKDADACIKRISFSSSVEELQQNIRKLCRIMLDDMPHIGLYIYYDTVLYSNRIVCPAFPDMWQPLRMPYEWYLNEKGDTD